MDVWLSVSKRRRMRAEIYDLDESAPICVIRFVLEEGTGPSAVEVVSPDNRLNGVLRSIGQRAGRADC